ncbi:MAG: hypothetical protein K8R64_07120 [Methanosarcinaceae archaeon]|nr:hypothetical protein [Methanosarcinaceae archaeon]
MRFNRLPCIDYYMCKAVIYIQISINFCRMDEISNGHISKAGVINVFKSLGID